MRVPPSRDVAGEPAPGDPLWHARRASEPPGRHNEDIDPLLDLLIHPVLGKQVWLWLGFLAVVGALLAFDLGVLHRHDKEIGVAESLRLSVFYIAVAVAFGAWLWSSMGPIPALEYFTGYAIEKALSIDNVFVISVIFGYFAIPARYQYRALLWGILAVLVLRGIMIGVGAALVSQYEWILFFFGAFLIITGLRMLFIRESDPDVSKNPLVRLLARRMPVTSELHGSSFVVRVPDPRVPGRMMRMATPLLLALIVINIADLVFAIDSVPAIFAITTDTYIVFTANIMAILGLRALYFALAAMVHRFEHLKYALAIVLVFIGAKIFWNHIVGKVDPAVSLAVTLGIIAAGILFSLWRTGGSLDPGAERRPGA